MFVAHEMGHSTSLRNLTMLVHSISQAPFATTKKKPFDMAHIESIRVEANYNCDASSM